MERINARSRERYQIDYSSKRLQNEEEFENGNPFASSQYTYKNQQDDAYAVWELFNRSSLLRIVSILKKTKVGCDGFMIELMRAFATSPLDNNMFVNIKNIYLITGMNNKGWEELFKHLAPNCVVKNIFHHGQLHKCDLRDLKNGLVIIDEVDVGNGEEQVLDLVLKKDGVLSLERLLERNNRVVCVSATSFKEMIQLKQWGVHHASMKMTIPDEYRGHKDLLDLGMIKEWYEMDSVEACFKWLGEDVLSDLWTEPRVHLIRIKDSNRKYLNKAKLQIEEIFPNLIEFYNHDTSDRLSDDKLKEIFEGRRTKHVVIILKEFYRRANLIPNKWKEQIGAIMERYTGTLDYNSLIQSFPGRMSGYIVELLDKGWKCIIRTSIAAIKGYEEMYEGHGTDYKTSDLVISKNVIKKNEPSIYSPERQPSLGIPNYNSHVESAKAIPLKITVTPEEYNRYVVKRRNQWNIDSILSLIGKYNKDEEVELKRLIKDQVYEPDTESGISTNIFPVLEAIRNGERYARQTPKHSGKDTYQILLYKSENTLLITKYYSSKITPLFETFTSQDILN